MSELLVSVIIPAYNAERFIAETLESVFNQTYRPLEVIVVDDGSTDGTAEIVKNYQKSSTVGSEPADGADLFYVYQENSGPSAARNNGLRSARGEYVAFVDADDLWTRNKLERQVRYANSLKDVALVFGDSTIFNGQGVIVDSAFKKYGFPRCDDSGRIVNAFETMLEKNYIPTGTVLLRKSCLERAGFFDENIRYGEDYDLWLRIALTSEIGCIDEIQELKRIHGNNLSKDEELFFESLIGNLQKINKRFSGNLKARGVDLNVHIAERIKRCSYFYYSRRHYIDALRKLCHYFYYVSKTRIIRVFQA
jgi:glycosyltransferase involved in cell wall biosynthesis